jgi:Rubisco Assembly chaperone C-terminal domain/Rubisco accumulation factor 1 alpha helical domain/Rubisco accumulation factor 1 helix turn helix domain
MGNPDPDSTLSQAEVDDILLTLRRKQGNWTTWGEHCQRLQKAGYSDQTIFEATGFEAIQQNQIMVASQVYKSIVQEGASEAVQAHFSHRASDVLYEFRVLSPSDRTAAADFAFTRQMDMDEAREMAKAIKDFSRISQPPAEFSNHPGDILAYFAWRSAKQKTDLQARSLLIARGLKYAQTETARRQIERLLTDFSTTATKQAPRLPLYRLDSDEQMPRVLPVVGKLPLSSVDFAAVPVTQPESVFGIVSFAGAGGAWMAVPGWQVIRVAKDPVVLLTHSDRLPTRLPGEAEEVVVICDRAQQTWKPDSYFVTVDAADQLVLNWFEQEPAESLLGEVILVMRPKKVLDEGYTQELYQWDE